MKLLRTACGSDCDAAVPGHGPGSQEGTKHLENICSAHSENEISQGKVRYITAKGASNGAVKGTGSR